MQEHRIIVDLGASKVEIDPYTDLRGCEYIQAQGGYCVSILTERKWRSYAILDQGDMLLAYDDEQQRKSAYERDYKHLTEMPRDQGVWVYAWFYRRGGRVSLAADGVKESAVGKAAPPIGGLIVAGPRLLETDYRNGSEEWRGSRRTGIPQLACFPCQLQVSPEVRSGEEAYPMLPTSVLDVFKRVWLSYWFRSTFGRTPRRLSGSNFNQLAGNFVDRAYDKLSERPGWRATRKTFRQKLAAGIDTFCQGCPEPQDWTLPAWVIAQGVRGGAGKPVPPEILAPHDQHLRLPAARFLNGAFPLMPTDRRTMRWCAQGMRGFPNAKDYDRFHRWCVDTFRWDMDKIERLSGARDGWDVILSAVWERHFRATEVGGDERDGMGLAAITCIDLPAELSLDDTPAGTPGTTPDTNHNLNPDHEPGIDIN